MGYSARPLSSDDSERVAALVTTHEEVEPAGKYFNAKDAAGLLTSLVKPWPESTIGLHNAGSLVAFGIVQCDDGAETWRAQAYLGVATTHTGKGLGRFILEELIERARVFRRADRPEATGEIDVRVESSRKRLMALTRSLGFRPVRRFIPMRIDLSATSIPVPKLTEHRTVPFSEELSELVRACKNEAFRDHWAYSPVGEDEWRAETLESDQFRRTHSWLAVNKAGTVDGFVLCEEQVAKSRASGCIFGYISYVGTSSNARGKGIASALMAKSLTSQAEEGYRYSELGVDAESSTRAGAIYETLGYRPLHVCTIMGLSI